MGTRPLYLMHTIRANNHLDVNLTHLSQKFLCVIEKIIRE